MGQHQGTMTELEDCRKPNGKENLVGDCQIHSLIMIVFQRARKEFSTDGADTVALEGLNLEVREGETVCLIGTSGSGKTTALKMVNRLVEPTSGCVSVDGKDVSETDEISLRRSIGYVIQRGGLFPHMTVAENIGLLLKMEGWEPDRITKRVNELLTLVNLPSDRFRNRKPRELSGGQQQRVSIARALAFDPAILLMDEPFGALDPITRNELHTEFQNLKDIVGKTTLIVTHDLGEAFKLGDRIVLLNEGRLIQQGKKKEFLENPASPFVEQFVAAHKTGVGP